MLKFGIIGSKYFEEDYIKSIKDTGSASLIGFYDSNKELCNNIEKRYNIKSFSSIDDLIESVDAMDFMSEDLSLLEYCIQSIKKSKHLIVSTLNIIPEEYLKKIIDLAIEASVIVKIKNIDTYNPAYIIAKPHISNPTYIETNRILSYSENSKKNYDILDLMIKDIEIVLTNVKSNVRKISASGVSLINKKLDFVNSRIEFDNACVANLTVSKVSKSNIYKTQFFSQDTNISIDFLNQRTEILIKKKFNSSEEEGKILFKKLPTTNNNPTTIELEDFFNSISNTTNSLNNAIISYQAKQVVQKIKDKIGFVSPLI